MSSSESPARILGPYARGFKEQQLRYISVEKEYGLVVDGEEFRDANFAFLGIPVRAPRRSLAFSIRDTGHSLVRSPSVPWLHRIRPGGLPANCESRCSEVSRSARHIVAQLAGEKPSLDLLDSGCC